MDILAYDYILQGLTDYNKSVDENYGNVIYSGIPKLNKNQTIPFPLTIFQEIRNVANPSYNTCHDRVSSVGYRADIYAKDKGTKVNKLTIARSVAKVVDEYLTAIGLTRVSFNVSENENDGSVYHIIMTYSGNLHENRRKFI